MTTMPENRGARTMALAARVGLKGFERPAATVPSASQRAVPRQADGAIDRESATMGLPEARNHPKQARHLARTTSLSLEDVRATLIESSWGSKRDGHTATPPVASAREALAPENAATQPAVPAAAPINRGVRAVALAARVGLKGFPPAEASASQPENRGARIRALAERVGLKAPR